MLTSYTDPLYTADGSCDAMGHRMAGTYAVIFSRPVVPFVIIRFVPVHFGLCLHDHAVNARHFSRCDIHSPQQRGIPFQ